MASKDELKSSLELAQGKISMVKRLLSYVDEYKLKKDNVHSNYEYDTLEDGINKFETILKVFLKLM